MRQDTLISVIVPVYKVEAYLNRCVDSILGQTYKNLEVILVDDGSPDGSGAICDEYAQKDARVRVIHKENGGLSSARNAGIDSIWYNPEGLDNPENIPVTHEIKDIKELLTILL